MYEYSLKSLKDKKEILLKERDKIREIKPLEISVIEGHYLSIITDIDIAIEKLTPQRTPSQTL